jgi:hypothetical protein
MDKIVDRSQIGLILFGNPQQHFGVFLKRLVGLSRAFRKRLVGLSRAFRDPGKGVV